MLSVSLADVDSWWMDVVASARRDRRYCPTCGNVVHPSQPNRVPWHTRWGGRRSVACPASFRRRELERAP